MESNPQSLPTPLPGEIVQQIIYDLIVQSRLTYTEAMIMLAFVMARLLHASTESTEIAGKIIEKIPEGVLNAYQKICLSEHEQSPGEKPN